MLLEPAFEVNTRETDDTLAIFALFLAALATIMAGFNFMLSQTNFYLEMAPVASIGLCLIFYISAVGVICKEKGSISGFIIGIIVVAVLTLIYFMMYFFCDSGEEEEEESAK